METRRFSDRTEAGELLGETLHERGIHPDIVLAIPRGGLPLGRAVTDALDAPLDIVVTKKIGAPGNPEYSDVETSYEPLMGSEEWYERAEETSRQLLEEAEELADEHDRDIATMSEIGDPKRVIVDCADEENVDHIVLGAHGRTEEDRPVFGSVAENVARRAAVPVTIVR